MLLQLAFGCVRDFVQVVRARFAWAPDGAAGTGEPLTEPSMEAPPEDRVPSALELPAAQVPSLSRMKLVFCTCVAFTAARRWSCNRQCDRHDVRTKPALRDAELKVYRSLSKSQKRRCRNLAVAAAAPSAAVGNLVYVAAPPPPQVPLMKQAARHDGLSPQFAPVETCCRCRPAVAGASACYARSLMGTAVKHFPGVVTRA